MTVWEAGLHRTDDLMLLRLAGQTGLIFITHDYDFAERHAAGHTEHAGILVLPQFGVEHAVEWARRVLEALDAGLCAPGACAVWDPEEGWKPLL